MIRLYREANGGLRFADGAVARSPRLRRWVEERRLEGERLHAEADRLFAENMALLGENEPTGTREVVHVVGDDREEALWHAWARLFSAN